MVVLTVLGDRLALCLAGTAMTIVMAKKADTEYDTARTIDGDKTKSLLVQCKPYHMNVDRRQKCRPNFLTKSSV